MARNTCEDDSGRRCEDIIEGYDDGTGRWWRVSRFVELSHPIVDGMTTYPGLPAPEITTYIDRSESATRLTGGQSFHIGRIAMVANTGTYLDAPFHFHADGPDVSDVPLERVADVPIVVIRASRMPSVDAALLGDPGRLWGAAVLVHTDWSRHWGTEAYLTGSPFLTAAAARALVDANVAVLGIDSLNVDDVAAPARPVHHTLLGAGIPVLEHLTNLGQVPDLGARLFAVPAPVRWFRHLPGAGHRGDLISHAAGQPSDGAGPAPRGVPGSRDPTCAAVQVGYPRPTAIRCRYTCTHPASPSPRASERCCRT
jgi:arylformamidase